MTTAQRLRRLTGGLPVWPLAILFALFFFDEWDTAAFNVLAPNIQSAFHLSDRAFGLLVIGNLSIVLLAAIPVGFYGDRLPRVRLVTIGAILAGIFSFLTGIAGTVAILALFRLGNGVGRLVNDPIHSSLLADYYRPEDRGSVYAIHRNAERFAQVVGPAVAGIVAFLAGWRVAFMVLLGPILVMAFVSLKLREPIRGVTDDHDAAMTAVKEPPVPFGEARRTLFAVPTLARQYAAFFFVGAALVPLAFLGPIFLQKAFGVGELGRGMVVALDGAGAVCGLILAGRLMPRWSARHAGEPMRWAGLSLVAVGVFVVATAYSPTLWLAIVFAFIASFVGGIFTPPFVTTLAAVSPARVRSLSFAWAALFLLAGVWVLYIIVPVSTVADSDGIRNGLAITAPYWVIGGLVMATCRRFVPQDIKAALQNLSSMASLRAQREAYQESGEGGVLLSCRGVTAAYDGVQVLFGVDFEVREGEMVALLGTNGAGKSTVLKAITGLLDPTGGLIVFEGRDITHADPLAVSAAGVAQMPGGRGIFPTLTVDEHLAVAAWRMRDKADESRAVDEVYAMFPRLQERRGQLAGNLSGGEQQQLALGMAFMTKPKLLLIDELSLGLSPVIVEQLVETVRRINATGVAVVIVEQSLNVALTLASRAYFLEKGEVRFTGPTQELLAQDEIVRSVFLAGATTAGAGKRRPPARAAKRQTAQTLEPAGGQVTTTGAALAARDVSVSFGGIKALTEVTIAVSPREILGLIGPNGAGKTTLFDVLSGFVTPSLGQVVLDGYDVTALGPDERARRGLGRSFQDARIFPSLTVAENLATALERHLPVRDHLADAFGLPAVREQEEDVAYSVADLVELMNLGAFRDKFVAELSTGSRRIVDLAMALAHDPSVLILDEPSSGIAQRETEALAPLLTHVRDETGCALLVIEHDMPLIAEISDRLIALDLGQVIAAGRPRDVLDDPLVVSSYLGGDPAAINRSGATPKPKRRTPATTSGRAR
jgi:branched-chain amino acid transport system ATP-binding protein